jgi:TATA-box binding protein (TBP) (component of TFIID and TFIIIB)
MTETGNKVSFNPETYSAVKIKTDKATISIFCSGSIIITGAQSLDDIIDTYVMLMNVLPPCKLATIANQKTDQFQYFQGLHLDSWKAHLFSQSTVNVI